MGTNISRLRLANTFVPIKCLHTGTFPAVRSLQHPLVIAFIWGHPLSAQAVSGVIPVFLLRTGHCHCLSVRLLTQNNNPNDKISLPVFLLGRNFCFSWVYLSFWPSVRLKVCSLVATIHSALHKPMISLLSCLSTSLLPCWFRLCPSFSSLCFFFLPSLFLSLTLSLSY